MNVAATLIGTKLGNYEVQSLIGSGGMARVYRGFDHNLQRPVAIKVLTDAAAAEPGVAARFQQEARFIARLRHPQIVQVYDFGEADGLAYMVQELLPGPTLEQELADHAARGQQLSRPQVLAIIGQLASALDVAHTAGIIHRDVKPSNAMRNAHGQLVLTDFGIARLTQPDTARTQAGLVIGTPDYISPEQAQGLPPTTASDIYALGVVLYEMLSGKRPFVADTPMGVVLGHIQQPPPSLVAHRPDLPASVDVVVQRALEKDPSKRFASAGALASALEQAWPAAAVASVHTAPTTAWAPQPVPIPAAAAATQVAPSLAVTGPTKRLTVDQETQVVSAPRPVPIAAVPAAGQSVVARRGLPLIAILAGILGLLLLGGVAMAFRGEGTQAASPTAASAAVVATAAPALAATALPEPATAPAEPTAAPAEPTPAPPEPTPAPPEPTSPPPEPANPVAGLRNLLQNALDRGQIEDGEDLLKKLDEVQSAYASGNADEATKKLRELRDKLNEDENIASDVRQGALDGVNQVAALYEIVLGPADSGDDGDDSGDDDDDKGKGKGKGKGKDK